MCGAAGSSICFWGKSESEPGASAPLWSLHPGLTPPARLLLGQLPQDAVQNPAVLRVQHLLRRVDADGRVERLLAAGGSVGVHCEGAARGEVVRQALR